jgi:nitrile hydratase
VLHVAPPFKFPDASAHALPGRKESTYQVAFQSRELWSESVEAAFDAAHAIEESLNWSNGARVVARAWSDPAYKARLLQDGTAACAELGFAGPAGEYIVVIEDTPEQKNAVVCTQCSCTAWPVLGKKTAT